MTNYNNKKPISSFEQFFSFYSKQNKSPQSKLIFFRLLINFFSLFFWISFLIGLLNGFHFFRLIPSSSHGAIDQTSMVFVAVVSIFIEVGLIYSIIVENFKLTVLYNVIMIAGLVFHLAGTEREIQNDAELNRSYRSFSFIYQTLFLCTFLVYTVGLKIRNYKADRLLRKNQIELIAKHKYSP